MGMMDYTQAKNKILSLYKEGGIAYEKVRQLLLDHPELNSFFVLVRRQQIRGQRK